MSNSLAALASSLAVNSAPVEPTLQLAVDVLHRAEAVVGAAIPSGLKHALLGGDDADTGTITMAAAADRVLSTCAELVASCEASPGAPHSPSPAAEAAAAEARVVAGTDDAIRGILLQADAHEAKLRHASACPSSAQLISRLPDEAELLSLLDEVRLLPLFTEAASAVGRPAGGAVVRGGGDADALNECCIYVRSAWHALRQLALECGGAELVDAVPRLQGVYALHP
jgi:hypothetical protein